MHTHKHTHTQTRTCTCCFQAYYAGMPCLPYPPLPAFGTPTNNTAHAAAHSSSLPLRRHGDELQRLPNNYYTALGRVDDTMNLGRFNCLCYGYDLRGCWITFALLWGDTTSLVWHVFSISVVFTSYWGCQIGITQLWGVQACVILSPFGHKDGTIWVETFF